jgi:predicted DNA-binding transcriptional regulator YafY
MDDRWATVTFQRRFDVTLIHRIATYGLIAKAGGWHLVWAGEEGHLHVDRLAVVRSVRIGAETFQRPPDFDLSSFWNRWSEQRAAAVLPWFRVQLRVRREALEYVRDTLGERKGVFPQPARSSSKWTDLDASFPSFHEARSELLALGGAVEVVAPPALRLSMSDYAEQIGRRYRSVAVGPSEDAHR